MANMTPEERERFTERMRARLCALRRRSDGCRRGGGRGQGPRQQGQAQTAKPTPSPATGATTFDALFGPLTQTESFGQVWVNAGGKLQRMRLHLGITDGQQTELIDTLDEELREGTEVVMNVVTGSVRQTPTVPGGGAFPGLGGPRQGGFPGGGGG